MLSQIIKSDCGCEFEISSTGQIFRWCFKHKAAEDMYEALNGLCPCMRPVPGGETPYEWAVSEKAMIAVREALAKAEGK